MEFLGIGPSELFFIILIAIIVLGPKDMQKAGRTIAKWVRSILMSDAWITTQQVSREAKKQWTHLIREANEDLNKISKETHLVENLKDTRFTDQHKTPARSISTETTPSSASAGPKVSPLKNQEGSSQAPSTKSSEINTEEHD